MSKIEWTDATWNPLAGCAPVSHGCANCYAAKMAKRLAAMGQEKYLGTVDTHGKWTGVVKLDEAALRIPMERLRPTTYFVNSMSDLFHEAVPDAFIYRVFAVMALCGRHRFQVLTKRAERMSSFVRHLQTVEGAFAFLKASEGLAGDYRGGPQLHEAALKFRRGQPLPNVALGVSVENQKCADERIPALLQCPAAVRFLSCEPLLGAVDLGQAVFERKSVHMSVSVDGAIRNRAFNMFNDDDGRPVSARAGEEFLRKAQSDGVKLLPMGDCPTFDSENGCPGHAKPRIDWVIAGGESGANARPMHPDWVRGLRDQCARAGVPFFFKQWGEYGPGDRGGYQDDPSMAGQIRSWTLVANTGTPKNLGAKTWVAYDPQGVPCVMRRVGKRAAGRVLDGVTHDGMPLAWCAEVIAGC